MSVQVMLFTRKDCPNCPQAKRIVEEVVSELGDQVSLQEFDLDQEDDLLTALQHQVMSAPAVVVGERLVAAGRLPTKEAIVEAFNASKAS